MQKQKVCSRANIANIGKEDRIREKKKYYFFLFLFSSLSNVRKTLRTFREHCQSEQGVPVSAFLQLDGLDQFRLDERINYTPQGISINMHASQEHAVVHAAAMIAKKTYFFLGSVRHDMMAIFSSPKSPFFKSAAAFEVDAIRRDDFAAFIARRFAAGNRKISEETAARLIGPADSVSGDVQ